MYGAGLPSMYGGMGSMYGGYGGGMGSMYGGGIGGGMGSMYGGGIGGGMGSMYNGGIGGGMGSMYNGGISAMNGGYGGSGVNGMVGSSMGGVLGTNDMSGTAMLRGEQAAGSLLPPQPDQQQPLQRTGPLAVETRQERRARRRQEKEAIERHKQQKRQLLIHSTIEIIGHVLQILFQLMRSGLELFGVGFGTYYSIKALKAIVKSQESAAPSNRPESAVVKAKNTPVSEYTSPLAGKWKSWILTVLLFAAMELAYRVQLRCRQSAPGGSEGRKRSEVGFDEEDELEDDLSESEECNDEDEWSEESDRPLVRPLTCRGNENSSGGRVYVAMYDYESPEREGYIGFRAGDRFLIDDYTESGWCHAVRAAEGAEEGRRGLVPGNFLRLFERETKL